MTIRLTKECTLCYFGPVEEAHVPEFATRRIPAVSHFDQRVFKSDNRFDVEPVKAALTAIQEELLKEKIGVNCPAQKEPTQARPSWKDQVNRKRQLIKRVIENRTFNNVAQIARFTKASKDTVRRVIRELNATGEVASYEYNNLKSKDEVECLEKTIEDIEEGFMTVTAIKRRHATFSRKKILEALHDKGFRYRLLPKEKKNKEEPIVNSTRICRVISHITQGICDRNTVVLYIDEMKFPLYQTAEKRWTHVLSLRQDAFVYNRRPVPDAQLTAIALCSLEKFEAVQFFKHEVTGADFLYFINTAISKLPPLKHYTIITDNASWHHADVVAKSKSYKFLYFNEPRLFQLNVIENAFSHIRHAFRCRPIVDSASEEVKNLLNMFFDKDNGVRFKGYFRNHLRMLQEFLEKHRVKQQRLEEELLENHRN